MKILNINSNISNLFFGRKNKTKKLLKEQRKAKLEENAARKKEIEKYGSSIKAFYVPFIEKFKDCQVQKDPEINVSQSFEETHGKFTLDKYQKSAVDAYLKGNSVIVSAPTGTGKTLIAEYIINDAIKNNKKVIYTSPLKALSNEKYTEFSKLFGTYDKNGKLVNTDNIGLMTGDTTINPEAPVLVMTTEVYRNSLMTKNQNEIDERYKDYNAVIYDEFQYLGDWGRGKNWEESIINTPKHMKQVMLSATASNSKEIAEWLNMLNPDIRTSLINVPENERYVPLREFALTHNHIGELELTETKKRKINLNKFQNVYQLSDKEFNAFQKIKEFLKKDRDDKVVSFIAQIEPSKNTIEADRLAEVLKQRGMNKDKAIGYSLALSDEGSAEYIKKREILQKAPQKVHITEVAKYLDESNMTPALFYIFSKRGCDKELKYAAKNGKNLLTEEETKEVFKEIQKTRQENVFLGVDFKEGSDDMVALLKGYAVHHAGRLPAYKSLVEKLTRKGLVKVCFATETLVAGINMPFRTTVFTAFDKKDDDNELLKTETIMIPNHIFKQGMGRAGRRGKDYVGNVVVMPKNEKEYNRYLDFSQSDDTSIKSKYRVSYASVLSDKMLNNLMGTLNKTLYASQNESLFKIYHNAMNKLSLLEKFGYVEKDENEIYKRTEKGDIASKVFGINEIFMTELLYNPEYLKDCTASELIAICGMFADTKDKNQRSKFHGELEYLNDRTQKITELADNLNLEELQAETIKVAPRYSTKIVPYVFEFANAPSERSEALNSWNEIMEKLRRKNLMPHEGDFLRIIGRTIDILRLVAELSPDYKVREEARYAIDKFKKAPLTDIFNYELNINSNRN